MDFEYKFYDPAVDGYNFFGYAEGSFSDWSLAHFLPLILWAVGIFLLWRYRDKIANWKFEETLRFIIAAVIILNEGFYYWRTLFVGNEGGVKQLLTKLPFQACEWCAYLSAFMLMKKGKSLFDVCYYMCLTLTIIPWFMPGSVISETGPMYARYYHFWIEHLLPSFSVFYMIFVHKFKADYKKVWKPFVVLGVLATFAIILNTSIEDANFLYLAKGTTGGNSIADVLPQSIPVRLVLYVGILLVLFALVSLPQIIPQIKAAVAKKKAAQACVACEEGAETAETAPAAEEVAPTETVAEKTEEPAVTEEKTE